MNNYKVETKIIQNNSSSPQTFQELKGESPDPDGFYELIENSGEQVKRIINISVQGPPGLKFYINNNNNPVIIGSNGIFGWEIKQSNTYIYSVKIRSNESIKSHTNIIITYEYIDK